MELYRFLLKLTTGCERLDRDRKAQKSNLRARMDGTLIIDIVEEKQVVVGTR